MAVWEPAPPLLPSWCMKPNVNHRNLTPQLCITKYRITTSYRSLLKWQVIIVQNLCLHAGLSKQLLYLRCSLIMISGRWFLMKSAWFTIHTVLNAQHVVRSDLWKFKRGLSCSKRKMWNLLLKLLLVQQSCPPVNTEEKTVMDLTSSILPPGEYNLDRLIWMEFKVLCTTHSGG